MTSIVKKQSKEKVQSKSKEKEREEKDASIPMQIDSLMSPLHTQVKQEFLMEEYTQVKKPEDEEMHHEKVDNV